MRVQAYIELDAEDRTEEQEEAFQAFCSHYLLSQYLIGSKDGREYYHCILVDSDNIPEMVSLMAARRPVVNGCWDIDGNPYLNESGNPAYSFDLSLHLTHSENEMYFDTEFNECVITETANTFTPMHGYAGWSLPTE